MANDLITVADLVADAYDLSGQEVSDLKNAAPLMGRLTAVLSSNGTQHKYSKYTQEPVVGFRTENDGRDFDHSVDTIVTETLKILDWSWAADKAVADAWRQGGAAAFVAREGARHMQAAMFKAEVQTINGTVGGDAAGFAGWADNGNVDALADEMVVNAGGTTIDINTSVYLIRTSEVFPVLRPLDGMELGQTIIQNMVGASGNFPAYYTPACAWLATQIGGLYSMARIVNVNGTDSGAALSDELIFDAVAKFPAGMSPDLIVMNRDAQAQLRASRTAYHPQGAPVPTPDSSAGIPILVTDAISNTEALIA
jgi:hypothetical protein